MQEELSSARKQAQQLKQAVEQTTESNTALALQLQEQQRTANTENKVATVIVHYVRTLGKMRVNYTHLYTVSVVLQECIQALQNSMMLCVESYT